MNLRLIFVLSAFTFLYFKGFSQDISSHKVPQAIMHHFQKTYPKAYDVEWEMDGNLYKVEFELGLLEVEHEIWYTEDGTIVRHKEELDKSSTPKSIQSFISENYPSYHIDDVDKIVEDNQTFYRLEIKSVAGKLKLLFDQNGTIID